MVIPIIKNNAVLRKNTEVSANGNSTIAFWIKVLKAHLDGINA